jgi:hypothetical protein
MNKQVLVAALFAVSTAACATDAPPPETGAPDQASPVEDVAVATFQSHTGTTVEIFGVGTTGYYAIEHGAVGVPRALGGADAHDLTPVELYRKATAVDKVPAALEELSARVIAADALAGTGVTRAKHSTVASTLSSTQLPNVADNDGGSCSATWFQAQGFCPTDASFTWCLLNHWNGAYAYDSDTDLAFSDICADIGDITWKITNGDGGYHLITVLEGQHYWYSFHDGGKSWVHFDVLNATNNRFQFGGEMYTY